MIGLARFALKGDSVTQKEIWRAEKVSVDTNAVGIPARVGTNVLVITGTYFYFGRLITANCDFIEIADPHIVYETGDWSSPKFADAQRIGKQPLLIQVDHIESVHTTEKVV